MVCSFFFLYAQQARRRGEAAQEARATAAAGPVGVGPNVAAGG